MLNKLKNLIGNTSRPKLISNVLRSAMSGGEFVLQEGDLGRIHVELNLIRRIVERAAAEVEGINEAKAEVEKVSVRMPLKIRFELSLAQNFSVNDVSAELVKAVKEVLNESLSISEVEIYVRVTDIARKTEDKRVRVR